MKRKLLSLMLGIGLIFILSACEKETEENYDVEKYFTLGEYKGIEVTVDSTEVTEEDIEERINEVLEENSTVEEITDRTVADGDTVNLDYTGSIDGEVFDGGSAEGDTLVIGSGEFIDDFEEQLIGAAVGEARTVEVTFPEDYEETYAGKDAVFEVTVNYIHGDTVTPELTDEFVQSVSDCETVDEYREQLRETLKTEKEQTAEANKMNDVWTAIVEGSEIKSYPDFMVDKQIEQRKATYEAYATQYGMELEDFISTYMGMTEDEFDSQIEQAAKNTVAGQMALKAIVEREGMELTDEEYEEGLNEYVEQYGYASREEFLEAYTEDDVRESLLWDKVLEFVTNEAVVVPASEDDTAE